MTAQPPAAPERDARRDAIPTDPEGDRARHDAWVATLTDAERSHGIPYAGRRIFMEQDVERIVAERVRVVEGERDAAPTGAAAIGRVLDLEGQVDLDRARAESAEAALAELRARVEALADEWATAIARLKVAVPDDKHGGESEQTHGIRWAVRIASERALHDLRALLGGAS